MAEAGAADGWLVFGFVCPICGARKAIVAPVDSERPASVACSGCGYAIPFDQAEVVT